MSYTSKHFQASWNYDPHGTTHNDRIGQILAKGVDLRTTLKQEAVRSAMTARAMELEQQNAQSTAPPLGLNSVVSDGPPKPDGRGMVWVDAQGNNLGPLTTETFQQPLKATSPLDTLNERQIEVAQMDTTQRSMHLWRKINPGCMASTTVVHTSRMKEDFETRDGLTSKVDKAKHRQKTDFSDYVEAKCKFAAKRA